MLAKTILIVDDEPEQVQTLDNLLSQRGYRVITASNGEEAMVKARNQQPHLIILDIMMPKIDGTQVAMLLKQDARTKDIPVFFITAVISADDHQNTIGHPNAVFAKPVRLEELLEAVGTVLADHPPL